MEQQQTPLQAVRRTAGALCLYLGAREYARRAPAGAQALRLLDELEAACAALRAELNAAGTKAAAGPAPAQGRLEDWAKD